MPKIHRYSVHPAIPPQLRPLQDLAYNLRWSWDHQTWDLFERLDEDLWQDTYHNPALVLMRVSQERLDRAAEDEAFLAHLERARQSHHLYMTETGWFKRRYPQYSGLNIAYFSMEFGLTESLPIYSGGLGVLAGDHLKAASELDIPLVAVGLLYQKGYFTQYLNPDGWQLERHPLNDFASLPIQQVRHEDGSPVTVSVELGAKRAVVQVWLAQVGRVPLYLLDTNVPENDPAEQQITGELYGGGAEDRLRQEMVLGIGGIRVLRAMGITPQVCHMNEGHSALLALERIRMLIEEAGLDYASAREVAGAGTIFTAHTPVPAGFDVFPRELMEAYFETYVKNLGLDFERFLGRGRIHPTDAQEPFNVAVLAVRHAPRRNAVSRLHRRTTARMMREGWPDFPEQDVPVDSITNGINTKGWISEEMAGLFDRYLGPRWQEDPSDPAVWQRVDRIPDEELWRTHIRQREWLVAYVRSQLELQLQRRYASRREHSMAREALRADALTIGFARRFATYKRATLILREVDRLKALLLDERRPVQIIFAGKAHPRDDAGKQFIREIIHFAKQEGVQHRLVFLEDYDLAKSKALVQGCDLWLNTPRRPMEACGTSGMKAAVNGVLHLSVLDGWWAEGYRPGAGWAIGAGEEYDDFEYQDRVESQALYSLLEQEVIPLFYDRGADGLPREWIAMMKTSIRTLAPVFSTARMLKEYVERCYLPASDHYARLSLNGYQRARELITWKGKITKSWEDVKVVTVIANGRRDVTVGSDLPLEAHVELGRLTPSDVRVEAYHGLLGADGSLAEGRSVPLRWVGEQDGAQLYQGSVPAEISGSHGYAVRVLPNHEDVLIPNEIALVSWE